MNHLSGICLSIVYFLTLNALARAPLDFPAEKNNVQVLPQKFEYSLRDASKLLLGNRIIDTDQFRFDLVFQETKPQITLSWPDQITQNGRIVIVNPSGLDIWSQPLLPGKNSIEIKDASTLLGRLGALSFFRFCVGYFQEDTGLDVCSPELMLRGLGEKMSIVPRGQIQNAQVQINGRNVTQHGIVFLNDDRETLSFRAISKSGAEFKMDTRRTKLEFVDVQGLNDKTFAITIEGAPPLAPSNFKKIGENRWSVPLPKDRPQIYVTGSGGVPLRQEFIVLGPLPSAAHRVYIRTLADQKTYSSNLLLIGEITKRGRLQPLDKGSEVSIAGAQFQWVMRNVPSGIGRTSYLGVIDGDQTFSASYKTSRQAAGRVDFGLVLNSEKTRLAARAEAQLWFENPLKTSKWSFQRLGAGLFHRQEISGDPTLINSGVQFYLRHKPGIQFWDKSLYLGLGLENWTFQSKSIQTFATTLGWMGPSPKWLSYFDWHEIDFKYSMTGKTSDAELKQALIARWKLYRPIEESQKLGASIGLQSLEIMDDTEERKETGLLLEAFYMWSF